MSYTRKLVCLANSRKMQGRCVAGKEIGQSGYGGWVRPVRTAEGAELVPTQIALAGGQSPRLLDIIKIAFLGQTPRHYQTENRLIDGTQKWMRMGGVMLSELPLLCDRVNDLWINGYHSGAGVNDRMPVAIANLCIKSSLLLIKPESLAIHVVEEQKRKVRARFLFHRTEYRLVVTDPDVENEFLAMENGIYAEKHRDSYLCISLGEPWKGYTYKLVAAIITEALEKK
jgi:hypothetical protein